MTRFLRVCLWVFLLALISAPALLAQSAPAPEATPPPAHLSLVEGQVFLDREGRSESAVENVPLLDGDRIRTERGRAEIMLGDGSLLHLDQGTTADVLAGDLIRLLQGRINIVVIGARDPSRAVRYQVDAPAASAQSNGPGEYRVTVNNSTGGRNTELAVVRGDATFGNDAGSVDVRAGERSVARDGEAPSRPQYFNSARWDEFDRWSAARRDAQIGTTSARYLPQDLEPYSGTFDRYGTWRNEASNGYVWFPTVSADWRPYSVGYWRQYDQWDSFWIAGDPWGWPTHHYGRWGFSVGLGWYWMPARSWAASFVYWAFGGDYVSWCPLGWNDYPVFGNWGVRGVYVGLHDGWHGWTVIPRRHFGSAVFASHVAIDGRRIDSRTRSAFVASRRSPVVGHAVPRGQGITATSRTGAVPRSSDARGVGVPGRGDRIQQRSAASETPRAMMRGQTERTQQAEARSPRAASTPVRYDRRTVPGAPAGGGPDNGVSATERQAQRSGWSSGRRSDPTAESGNAGGMGRRSLPEATPRVSTSQSPRAEPRPSPRERSWGTSSAGADERRSSRPTGRSAPDIGSRAERSSTATPRRGFSSDSGSSSPSSRYNSGSATQRSPSRGTSSPRRGRGGAPE
ncbi:MAG: FecR domain-containing protein [Acidobacteria bacterium]|nr:FecR domain-containing protein [Acidobacteriota bacterium]